MIAHRATKHSRTPNMPGKLSAKIVTTGANSGLCPDHRAVTHSIPARMLKPRGRDPRAEASLPRAQPATTSRGIAHVWITCTPPVVKHLQPGCLNRQCDPHGNVYRRTITSLAFKGEATPRGVSASWVVSESVERAVGVLEQLQADDAKYLFTTLAGAMGYRGSDRSMSTCSTNTNLNEFVDWINDNCAVHNRADVIPLVRRQRWKLSTSQFRTLAWFVARRPGGAIAGTIQYRHHSIQMFEGYAKAQKLHQTGELRWWSDGNEVLSVAHRPRNDRVDQWVCICHPF